MERNQLLLFMCESEENESQRVASELSNKYNIVSCENETPRTASKKYTKIQNIGKKYRKKKRKERASPYLSKLIYGYVVKAIENHPKIDHKT